MKTIDLAYDYSVKPMKMDSKKKFYPSVRVEGKGEAHCEAGDKVVLIGKISEVVEKEGGWCYQIEVQKFVKEYEDLGSSLDKILANKNKEKNEQDEY